ncbi:uncharacterized protein LOC142350643 isoform X3 [Convolutriloba macropyga]|uniref:uncharacterized protein LOC142350643 isoform X3 n=1 Tax=Convolutriloba macropyga TaxID=536237 RepID=UPI003F51BF8B
MEGMTLKIKQQIRLPTKAGSNDTSNYFQDAGQTPVELDLGRKVRLPAVTDFDLCEPVLFKPTSTSTSSYLHYTQGNEYLIHPAREFIQDRAFQ